MNDIKKEFENIKIPWWKKKWWDFKFYIELLVAKVIGKWYQHYIDLFWLHYYGFYPIGIAYNFVGEHTFIFKTKLEADRAFQKCEKENTKAIGWYHSLGDFRELQKECDWETEIWWVYE